MIRAVIDTNVLVSSLISPQGNEALVILAIQSGIIVPCVMETILDEYLQVLTRPKFKLKPDRIVSLLTIFRDHAEMFEPTEPPFHSSDWKDTKFLQCAFVALADFLITGNKRHFPASPYGTTHVVNAGELLSQMTMDVPPTS